jgi:hypothetical protein
MDGATMVWLLLGGAFLLIGTMSFVAGITLVTAESGQRTMAVFLGILLGVMGGMVMVYLAAPRATMAAYNGVLFGSIISGAIAAALLGWKRMAG